VHLTQCFKVSTPKKHVRATLLVRTTILPAEPRPHAPTGGPHPFLPPTLSREREIEIEKEDGEKAGGEMSSASPSACPGFRASGLGVSDPVREERGG
jgi:hypothetical protein